MMPAISEEPDIKTESDTDTLYNASSYFASSPSSNYDSSDQQRLLGYASDLEEGLVFLHHVFEDVFRKLVVSYTHTLAWRLFSRWYKSKESIIKGPWLQPEQEHYALRKFLASASATCGVEIPAPSQRPCDAAIDRCANIRELFGQAEKAKVQCCKAYESINQYRFSQCFRKGLYDPFTCGGDISFMHLDGNSELCFVSNLGDLDALGSFLCKNLPYGLGSEHPAFNTETETEITIKQMDMKRINQSMENLETASRALSAARRYCDFELDSINILKQGDMQQLDHLVSGIRKLLVQYVLEGDEQKLQKFELTFDLCKENYPWVTI